MYCEKCGALNDDQSKFCEKCGNRMSASQKKVHRIFQRKKIGKSNAIIVSMILVVIVATLAGVIIAKSDDAKSLMGKTSHKGSSSSKAEDTWETMEVETESEPRGYEVYPRSEQWDLFGLTFYDKAIQIDDTVYALDINITDTESFFFYLELSDIEYTYDYNPDKLLAAYQSEDITIYRDGMEWIDLYVCNLCDSTVPLSRAKVSNIWYTEYSQYYCRYFGGSISHADILNMSYTEAWEWVCEKICGVSYEEYAGLTKQEKKEFSETHEHVTIKETYDEDDEDSPIYLTAMWRENYICTFIINRNTSQVCDFIYYWGAQKVWIE